MSRGSERAGQRPRRGLYVLPSLFTAGNIAAGFYAITQCLQATDADNSYPKLLSGLAFYALD